MNRGWTKILISIVVIVALLVYLGWPRRMPDPDEKNRTRSPGGMSLILPPEWEAVQLKETGLYDDGFKLRPVVDGKLQPSILLKRFSAQPKPEELVSNAFKRSDTKPFQGKPVWFFEGVTKTEYLYRFVFESNSRWHELTLSTPMPIDYSGSDWQSYMESFKPGEPPAATTTPATLESKN